MARLPSNIEKSRFPVDGAVYVGYGAGMTWRIFRDVHYGWRAMSPDGTERLYGYTLAELGRRLCAAMAPGYVLKTFPAGDKVDCQLVIRSTGAVIDFWHNAPSVDAARAWGAERADYWTHARGY